MGKPDDGDIFETFPGGSSGRRGAGDSHLRPGVAERTAGLEDTRVLEHLSDEEHERFSVFQRYSHNEIYMRLRGEKKEIF
jgi:hypothetical protein